jgi:hypothetical protein
MLTNSKEYKELELRIAFFLNIKHDLIESIVNPLRRKKKTVNVWLVSIEGVNRKVLLRDINGMFIKIN